MKFLLFLVCVFFVYTYAETNIHFNFEGMIPDLPTCGCGSVCGDGFCNADEDELTCPNDCVIITPDCGDGACDDGSGEDPFTCPEDCSVCGDGICDNTESLSSCLPDCVACGDGICSTGETVQACPADCSNICGNNLCEAGESFETCPQDCDCQPTCPGNCGDDGCGGSCGTCNGNDQCVNNFCTCQPQCSGRQCGDDGCGGSCGTCPTGQACNNGICAAVSNCNGKQCGDDGAGGSCGTCATGQQCVNFQCVCQSQCSGRQCGDDGCGGSCGTCPDGQFCSGGSCLPDSNSRLVTFNVFTIRNQIISTASGVTISSGTDAATTNATMTSVTIMVSEGAMVTFSGSDYETFSVEMSGSASEVRFLVPPKLQVGQLWAAALWSYPPSVYDLDFNMFGPGNRTQYPQDEGVINWEWEDKSEQLPYGRWYDVSSEDLFLGAELIDVATLDATSVYDFMLFHWSRVGQNDDSGDFTNAGAQVFIFGGTETGIGAYAFDAVPPTPPAGFVYGYFSPFRLEPSTNGHQVVINQDPFEPPISIADIEGAVDLYYDCAYPSYCPYLIPV